MAEQTATVRRAVPSDADAISSLLQEAFQEFETLYTPGAYLATVQPSSGVLARMAQGPVWVAEHSHGLMGTIAAVREANAVMIRGMAVHPAARGLGIGRMLLARTQDFARECDAKSVCLYTTSFLNQAIRLYSAVGFEFTGETIAPNGVELLRMVKSISAHEGDGNRGGLLLR